MDADAVRKQKDRAAELVAKGKLPAALEAYRGLLRDLPSDLSLRQKVADLLNRTGNPRAAIAEYDAVVQAYAERGELLKAISLAKVILQIDPAHRATEARLAELYSRQLGEGPRFAASAPLLGRSAAPQPLSEAKPPSGAPGPEWAVRPATRAPSPEAGARPRPSGSPRPIPAAASDPFAPVAPLPPIVPPPPAIDEPTTPSPSRAQPPPGPDDATRLLRAAPPEKASYVEVKPAALASADGVDADATLFSMASQEPAGNPDLTKPILPLPRRVTSPRPAVPRRRAARPAPGASEQEEVPTARLMAKAPAAPGGGSTSMLSASGDEDSALHLEVMRDTEARQTGNFPAWRGPTRDAKVADLALDHATLDGVLPIPSDPGPPLGAVPALPKIPLFSAVPREAFMALVAGAQVRTASPGDRLLVEGSPGDSLFAIVQGLVTLRKRDGQRERPFAAMGPGEFFGELSVVSQAPRLATVVAEDDTVLLEFPRAQLQPILQEHAAVRIELERLSRERLFASLLRATPLFDGLDADARTRLQGALEVRVVAPDEVVVRQGQSADGLYVVLRGKLRVTDSSASPDAVPLPDLEEGDLVAALASLLGEPLKATVSARTQAVLAQIPPEVLAELLPHQRVLRQLLAALARERWNLLTSRRRE